VALQAAASRAEQDKAVALQAAASRAEQEKAAALQAVRVDAQRNANEAQAVHDQALLQAQKLAAFTQAAAVRTAVREALELAAADRANVEFEQTDGRQGAGDPVQAEPASHNSEATLALEDSSPQLQSAAVSSLPALLTHPAGSDNGAGLGQESADHDEVELHMQAQQHVSSLPQQLVREHLFPAQGESVESHGVTFLGAPGQECIVSDSDTSDTTEVRCASHVPPLRSHPLHCGCDVSLQSRRRPLAEAAGSPVSADRPKRRRKKWTSEEVAVLTEAINRHDRDVKPKVLIDFVLMSLPERSRRQISQKLRSLQAIRAAPEEEPAKNTAPFVDERLPAALQDARAAASSSEPEAARRVRSSRPRKQTQFYVNNPGPEYDVVRSHDDLQAGDSGGEWPRETEVLVSRAAPAPAPATIASAGIKRKRETEADDRAALALAAAAAVVDSDDDDDSDITNTVPYQHA
jgi:hypothetical protein